MSIRSKARRKQRRETFRRGYRKSARVFSTGWYRMCFERAVLKGDWE